MAGFFDDVFDIVDNFFKSPVRDIVEPVARGVTTIIGERGARRANERATDEANRAAEQRAAEIAAGRAEATRILDEIIRMSQPGADALRDALSSDPSQLTPTQEREVARARRDADATLAATGLRGAGRAVTAAIRDVEEGKRGQFFDINQRRSDRAAEIINQPRTAAITGQATLAAGTGEARGVAAETTGLNTASRELADANLRGRALADITSLSFDARRPRARRFEREDREVV